MAQGVQPRSSMMAILMPWKKKFRIVKNYSMAVLNRINFGSFYGPFQMWGKGSMSQDTELEI